jgi:hypothetical protein
MAWASPPPVHLSLRSHQSVSNLVTRIAESVSPGAAADLFQGIHDGLGINELKGVDVSRPWHVSVWAENLDRAPSVSIRIPVTDFAAFQDGLEPGLLQGEGEQGRITNLGDYARIWMELSPASETVKAAEKAWTPPVTTRGAVDFGMAPGDELRGALVGMVGMGRMAFTAAMSQGAAAMPGMDPASLGELMGVYFDLIQMGIQGLEQVSMDLDLQNEVLVFREEITALAGSELGRWFQTQEGRLGQLAASVGMQEGFGLAMRIDDNPDIVPRLKQFVTLSMSLQGVPADSEAARETAELMEAFLPMEFAGAGGMEEAFEFAGIYRFPGKDPARVYAVMQRYLKGPLQEQVGPEKPYQSVVLQENHRTVEGLSVDRVTMTLNLDSGIYQMPGQREMLESFWPEGKIVFDYALRGDQMLMGSPEKFEALLAKPSTTAAERGYGPHTMAYGHFNLLRILPRLMALDPGADETVMERISQLDTSGTALEFRLDMDGRLNAETRLPLKLLKVLGDLNN